MRVRYRIKKNMDRKHGAPLLLMLTKEEHEYLERIVIDRGGKMGQFIRGTVFKRGWRHELDLLREEQTPSSEPPPPDQNILANPI